MEAWSPADQLCWGFRSISRQATVQVLGPQLPVRALLGSSSWGAAAPSAIVTFTTSKANSLKEADAAKQRIQNVHII